MVNKLAISPILYTDITNFSFIEGLFQEPWPSTMAMLICPSSIMDRWFIMVYPDVPRLKDTFVLLQVFEDIFLL